MTRRIKLTQGQVALVDDEDYERINAQKWCAWWNKCTKSYYALSSTRDSRGIKYTIRMHRVILGLGPWKKDRRMVDHISHKTLDNRKSNLRVVTHRENCENLRNQSKHGVGVSLAPSGRFRAQTKVKGRTIHIGTFDIPKEARQARTKFLKSLSHKEA